MKKYYTSIGRRKRSIALIYLKKKKSNTNNNNIITINKKSLDLYFINNIYFKNKIFYPLLFTNNLNNSLNINIKVKGGGFQGQLEAIILALSKILCNLDPNNIKILKKQNLLTRDSRRVERKKYGRKKARKKFQFSKR
ncbi:MAG: 30S ribosomal protein S9 [Candidatus Shikimatogenerans bostrichidophilus]|nr:MAG: 30S ribosomal protein S9 [Candidatus Shikimatogenerans bostrichidophilus]